MKVSVCIPTYNSALFLRECLDSVLTQTFADFEIVVSDNGSQDNTLSIIKSYRDDRIRVFSHSENHGMTWNFNFALHQAKGDYIKLLMSDDALSPDCLQEQAATLDRDSSLALIGCARELMGASSGSLGTLRWFKSPVKLSAANLKLLALIFGNVLGEPTAVMFRRITADRTGPFKDGLSTLIDLEMWLRLSDEGAALYLPKPLCRIRQHSGSMTTSFRGSGVVQESVFAITEQLLTDLNAGWMLRKASIGKVAGSCLRNGCFGLLTGSLQWPLRAFFRAWRLDPWFAGLILVAALRRGWIGLRWSKDGALELQRKSILRLVGEPW